MSLFTSSLKSPVPLICQLGPGLNAHGADAVTLVPSISHIAGLPLSSCQRMSLLAVPVEVAGAVMCQVGPGLNEPTAPAAKRDVGAIHQPDRRRAVLAAARRNRSG